MIADFDELYEPSKDFVCDSHFIGDCSLCTEPVALRNTCRARCETGGTHCNRNNWLSDDYRYAMCLEHFAEHTARHYHHRALICPIFHDEFSKQHLLVGHDEEVYNNARVFGGYFNPFMDENLVMTGARELAEQTRGIFGNTQQILEACARSGQGVFFKQTLVIFLDMDFLPNMTDVLFTSVTDKISVFNNPSLPPYRIEELLGPNITPAVVDINNPVSSILLLPFADIEQNMGIIAEDARMFRVMAPVLDKGSRRNFLQGAYLPIDHMVPPRPLFTTHGAVIEAQFVPPGLISAVNVPNDSVVNIPVEIDMLYKMVTPFQLSFEQIANKILETIRLKDRVVIIPKGTVLFHMTFAPIHELGAESFLAQSPELSLRVFVGDSPMPPMMIGLVSEDIELLDLCAFENTDVFFKEIVRILLGRQLWHRTLRAVETFEKDDMIRYGVYTAEEDEKVREDNLQIFTEEHVADARIMTALAYFFKVDGIRSIDRLDDLHTEDVTYSEFAVQKQNPLSVMSSDAFDLHWFRELIVTNPNKIKKICHIPVIDGSIREQTKHVVTQTKACLKDRTRRKPSALHDLANQYMLDHF